MSNAVVVPQCTHVKTNGEVCGSPAVSGTELCYHHSTVKTTLAKAQSPGKVHSGGFAPIPFVFPEDRASMQINFFLLLQAYNEQRINQRTYNAFLAVLRSMARNLGKTGRLTENSDQRSAVSDQKGGKPTSQKRDVGHPQTSDQRSAVSDQKGRDQGTGRRAQETQASAPALFVGPIAPESCFSTNPKVHVSDDMFQVSTLDLAMQGSRRATGLLSR